MKKKKVVISTSSFARHDKRSIEMLKKANLSVTLNPHGRRLTESEVKDMIKDADLLIAGTEPLSREVLESAKTLKLISRCGAGLDNVDLKAAKERGIEVRNTPDAPTLAVAELTVGLMLNLIRKVSQADRELRNGTWKKRTGNLLQNKRIGIIGFGRIGQKVAQLLLPFEVDISYNDVRKPSCPSKYKKRSIKSLFSWADIISLHCTKCVCDKPIIGVEELKSIKPGAYIINTARGCLVDENALCAALKNGRLGGAALDVFEREPYEGPLKEIENVILTPHIGAYAKEARVRMEIQAVENLLKGLKQKGSHD